MIEIDLHPLKLIACLSFTCIHFRTKPLLIVHGEQGASKNALQGQGMAYDNIKFCQVIYKKLKDKNKRVSDLRKLSVPGGYPYYWVILL